MAEIPVIQVLDKEHYTTQALVPLPDALPLPPLADSSLRIRTEVFSLTLNNFTYARLGDLVNWWDVHPLPASTPAPYNNPAKYGRINCWGYARVLESTFPGVPPGSYVYGYLPIGTLPLDISVEPASPEVPDHVVVTSPYRKHLLGLYNRYTVFPPDGATATGIAARSTPVALDCLFRVMHLTGYLLAEHAFAADPASAVNPGMDPSSSSSSSSAWGPAEADLANATVLVFAPGSKAGLSFAYALRGRTPPAARPRRVVGVASSRTVDFVRATGLYDEVLDAGADPTTAAAAGAQPRDKVAVLEFGGRGGAAARWALALQGRYVIVQFVGVGSEQPAQVEKKNGGKGGGPPPTMLGRVPIVMASAENLRLGAMEKLGEGEYYRRMDASWEEMRREGFKGFSVVWGQGMEDAARGWERLGKGDVGPEEGLVYKV